MANNDQFLPKGFNLQSNDHVYTIDKMIGSGGFGITYTALTDVKLGNLTYRVTVAIKEMFLKSDFERSDTHAVSYSVPSTDRVDKARKDFIREAQRLRDISGQHPNIVCVNEVFEANNTAYYVMEHLQGQTLEEYIKQHGPLDEKTTIGMIKPIIDAVAFLHRSNITHLDIKPANIMLAVDTAGNERPVLIDFGLSKHYNDDGSATSTINVHGYTDGFAPEEQYAGISTFSPASDVYSLAATIVFCLTGKVLPKAIGLQPATILAMLPQNITPAFRSWLMGALATHVNDRTPNAGVMLSQLNQVIDIMNRPAFNPGYGTSDDDHTMIINSSIADVQSSNTTIIDPTPLSPVPDPKKEPGKEPKKKKTNLVLLIIILTILVLAIIGACLYFILGNGKGNDSVEADSIADSAWEEIMVEEVVEEADTAIAVDSVPAIAPEPVAAPAPAPKPKAKPKKTTTPTASKPTPSTTTPSYSPAATDKASRISGSGSGSGSDNGTGTIRRSTGSGSGSNDDGTSSGTIRRKRSNTI
ncbi:MAG: serine/threonine protein kinase [Bacteroides sp.]|nr:serine/threonine protein kinase [Bacteroides sp.]MCM1412886.1 serine/threonine protein kinase [Bacteroides sp.]MCM1471555.1 serine/threonine protein kinase [Bacteroides sp.]